MTLAELAVKLTANTAEFISGFSNAGIATKRFRADLSDHVQAIGGALDGVLSHFGEFGATLGQTLDGATQAASRAIGSFGKFGGVVGTIAGVGAGAAAAMLAIEGGAVALAIHTAETAAKLGEMSEKAGVSSRTLAGLALAGRGVGVETESLVKSLGFMNNSAVKAAIAADFSKTAYGRLGIEVKDASGHVRDSGAIFLDAVSKISGLPATEQGYFVRQIFGKGGLEILPLINKGVDGIREKMELAGKFGLGDPATVDASRKFKENVDDIRAAFEGVTLELTKELLPTIQFLSEEMLNAAKNGDLKTLVHDLAEATRQTLELAHTLKSDFEQIGLFIEYAGREIIALFNLIGGGLESIGRFSIGDFSGAKQALGGSYDYFIKQIKDFDSQSRAIWDGNTAFIDGIYGRKAVNPFRGLDTSGVSIRELARTVGASAGFDTDDKFHSQALLDSLKDKKGSADLSPTKEDTTLDRIKERIKALQQEAVDWRQIASAGTQSEALIAEAVKKGNEEFGKLSAEAAKDKTGRSLPLVLSQQDFIKAAAASGIFGKAIQSTVSELDKTRIKFDEQAKSAISLGEAYLRGGAAIAAAGIDKQLEGQQREVDKLTETYAREKAAADEFAAGKARLNGAIGPVQGKNVPIGELELLKGGVDLATASLAKLKDQLSQVLAQSLTAELIKQGAIIAGTKPYVDALNTSYSQGETAVRKARIELELYQFEQDQLTKGIVLTTAQKEKERAILEQTDRQAYQGALAQEAAQFSLNAQYDSQITKLQRVREILQQNGQSTLLIDARLHDAQDGLLHQWDEAAFKVGTFSQKFKGVMGELVIQGRAAGQAISQAFLGAIDGIETNLAKLLTGQKTNFKQVAQGLAEQVTKAEIQKGVGSLAGKFGLNIPGLTGKPDGSSESLALWVKTVGAAGTPSVGSVGNLLSSFRSGSGGDSGGGFFSKLLSSFGGFKAGGGDMSPGSWYVAGERGPEIVTGPGSVIPNHALGGRTTNITHNHNYPSAQSRDLFGRTQQQNQARQVRNSRMAYGF